MSVEDEMTEKLGIFDKSIIHTVYTCICHIYTTCSYLHLTGLIVKKIPQALKLFVFFFTILRYQTYYTCSFKSCIILFSSAKNKNWILPKGLIQHSFVTYTFLKRLR